MFCITIPTVSHLYVLPLAAPCNDYLDSDGDSPDEDETCASVRGLLHHRFPQTHHALRHLVQIPLLVRVTPLL